MNFLESLTDLGLRRLYKFVIKALIGKYLEDELLIDQLSVRSRDGEVILSDISLNCDVLNSEFLDNLHVPFRISKASIKSMKAKLSYTLLLAEGCQFFANGLEIVFEPISQDNDQPSRTMAQNQDTKQINQQSKTNNSKDKAINEEHYDNNYIGDKSNGLEFIARWIDIILASLKLQVDDISIKIMDKNQSNYINLSFDRMTYYNSNPQFIGGETSASMSMKSLNDRSFNSGLRVGEEKVSLNYF
jgi:hypothetical protein